MKSKQTRILIADDNELNRNLLSQYLKRLGHESETAINGRDTLDKLKRGSYDLLLLDIMMPEVSGYDVLEAMHEKPEMREIPVIVISAIGEIDSIVRCIELGAEDYLLKPYNRVLLEARIQSSLEKKFLQDERKEALKLLEVERARSDSLLLNILPEAIAERLKDGEQTIADHYPDVSVLFADMVNFTPLAASLSPSKLIKVLNDVFSRFDVLIERCGLEKIKTNGDGYMVVGGMLVERPDHPLVMTQLAQDMINSVAEYNAQQGFNLELRIGLDVGPVVAGIVGTNKFLYDLWGHTVNTASRMEAYGLSNQVHMTPNFYKRIAHKFKAESCGEIEIKGLGKMETYLLSPDSMYALR